MTGKFVTYRSSAGSGKTYTLVKEFLKLALHSESSSYYKRVLAITFTNKAASEMKERVIKQLISFSKAKEGNKYNSNLLNKKDLELLKSLVQEINETYKFASVNEETLLHRADQTITNILHNYSDLSISTIDSFVHGIIRSFARDMDLDTEFEVALDQDKIIQITIKDLLSNVGKDKELTALVMKFVSTRIDDAKGWKIEEDLIKFGKNIFKDSAQFELTKLKEITPKDFLKIRFKLYAAVEKYEAAFDDYGKRVLDLIEAAGIDLTDFTRQTVPNFFINITHNIQKNPIYYPSDTLQAMMAGETKWLKKAASSKLHLVEYIRDEITWMYHEILEKLGSEEMKTYQKRKLILKHFFSNTLLNSINDYTNRWKEDNNTVMVSDFNHMISKIILNNPAPYIYEKIGEQYLHILIDEFQDTNILQWQNFLPLMENSLSKGKFNMVVGDAKQAIYRWRDGEVMQFVKLPDIYKPLTNNIASIASILRHNHQDKELGINYRSSNEVITFNNLIYKNLSKHLGEYQEIYKGLKQEIGKDKRGLVTIQYYSGKEKIEKYNEQFNLIIKKISDALDDGYDQKDIAILCRSNKEGKIIAEKLLDHQEVLLLSKPTSERAKEIIEQGLSVITSDSLLLHMNVRIKILIALSKITSNPEDEKSKVDLLTNLSKLDLLSKPIHEILHQYKSTSKEKGKRKKTTIDFTQFMTDFFPKYFDFIYNTQGIYEILESFIRLFNFETKADNYLEFFLHTIMADPTMSLVDFINWWDENGDKISVGESSGSEGIRILTIHKSKGLQFPVVIVPIKINKTKPANIWLDKDVEMKLPTALVSIAPSEKNSAISNEILEEKNKALLDKINQLYVATTRPEDRLHMILELPQKPNFEELKHTYQYLNQAISDLPREYIKKNNEISIGKRTKKEQKTAQKDKQIFLTKYFSKPLTQGVQISFKKGEQWLQDDTTNGKEYGIIIHELLSHHDIKHELVTEIDRMINTGILQKNLKNQIQDEITQLLGEKNIKKWFDQKYYQKEKSEKELITNRGKIIRPDKVVYLDNKIDVIDFKTGEKRNSHKYQVLEYVTEIQKTSTKPVQGYLVYTKTKEVIPVKAEAQLSMF